MEHSNGQMEENIQVNGKRGNSTVVVRSSKDLAKAEKVNGLMVEELSGWTTVMPKMNDYTI